MTPHQIVGKIPLSLATLWLAAGTLAAAQPPPPFIPWPKALEMQEGSMTLTASSRILAASPGLEPLARVLAEEIRLQTGLVLATGSGQPGPGDIGMALDPSLKDEAHRLLVSDKALVQGGNYVGTGMASVTPFWIASSTLIPRTLTPICT